MDYASVLTSALRAPRPTSRAMQASVMSKPNEAPPEINADLPIESVSPEDWIPNPKSAALALAGALKGTALKGIIGGGAMGAIDPKLVLKMLHPESEHFKRIAAGETPESVMRDLRIPEKPEFINGSMFPNNPVRYETSRKLFDPGTVHYDATGGPQTMDIMAGTGLWPSGGSRSKASRDLLDANSQFRVGDYSVIHPDQVIVTPRDRWAYDYGKRFVPKEKYEFYRNDFEGNMFNDVTGMATPSAKDVLNDPELRRYWNFSLAAPSNSLMHKLAKVLRRE